MRFSKTLDLNEKLTSKGTVFYKNIWYKLFYMYHIYIILTINFLYYNLIVTTRDGVFESWMFPLEILKVPSVELQDFWFDYLNKILLFFLIFL